MAFDVKSIRPTSIVIIAGPYTTKDEAQMHATRLGLDFQKWIKDKREELKSAEFDDDLDKRLAERDLEKFIAENETRYEVVMHKRGGI